jgi:hypothetical protein
MESRIYGNASVAELNVMEMPIGRPLTSHTQGAAVSTTPKTQWGGTHAENQQRSNSFVEMEGNAVSRFGTLRRKMWYVASRKANF